MRSTWGDAYRPTRRPACASAASIKAETDPLPLVPATWIERKDFCGSPRRAARSCIGSKPTRIALRGRPLKRPSSVLGIVFLGLSRVACASRPETGFLSAVAYSPPGAVDHTLLVATTRERDDRPGTLFNGDRANATDYAEITVSIPP